MTSLDFSWDMVAKETGRYDSVFEASVTKHSKKPEEVYGMIEAMYTGPYIELFARNKRKNWDVWGDEIIQ